MPASFSILQYIRGALRRPYSGSATPQNCDQNSGGDLLVSQGLPERTELVRMGNSFSCQIPLTSAFTAVITIPTTLSELALQNGEAVGGKSYIIERFWLKNTTTTASLGVVCPLSQVVPPGTAQVADDVTVLRMSLSGKTGPAARTNAKICMHSILTGCLLDKWNHHTSLEHRATTNIGHVVEVNCLGKYIIPPLGSFNINAQFSVVGAAVAIGGIEWHEVQLDAGA